MGDVKVKQKLARAMNAFLEPLRRRRGEVLADPGRVEWILRRGIERARAVAWETMEEVRKALGGNSIAFGAGLQ
ncbi:MAG: hypothetical protein ACK44W_06525 [Planctomycetota bacterium]